MSAASLFKRKLVPDDWPQGAILQAADEPGVNLLLFGASVMPHNAKA